MPNHLAAETSPYLRQHVNNPVDWFPWGEDAISFARNLDRPIFLSIGYSACHWCHVMEHESFENQDIAQLMNQWFVCIKVDREERPDLDQIYMNAVQAMTGSGGWPMSVFLNPQLKPFFGGTYWPPTARWGRPGFREILAGVHDAWINRRDVVNTQADELTEHVRHAAIPSLPPSPLSQETLRHAMASILNSADRVHGGFGSAPKFPHPMDLRLAMRCWKRFGGVQQVASQSDQAPSELSSAPNQPLPEDPKRSWPTLPGSARSSAAAHSLPEDSRKIGEVLDVVTHTLDKMARGGIYDHLGGGFSRYSTDERWLVPHFEKMLYDNAQLVPAYLEAFQITGRTDFSRVARETLDYVLREMTQPQGGFYSTQDADSEGIEGKFFVWNETEVDAALEQIPRNFGVADRHSETLTVNSAHRPSNLFKHCYDVTARGNWEHSNILNRSVTDAQAAESLAIDSVDLDAILTRCRKALFDVRSRRVWPGRDEKVLVSWNGLMIAAMAMGANVLNEPRYAEAACAAADFILKEMVEPTARGDDRDAKSASENMAGETMNGSAGRESDRAESPPLTNSSHHLFHCYKDGQVRFNAYLDDYAALIDGLCELYQAVFDAKYLDAALGLAERMIDQFWDAEAGGFFFTSLDHEALIARNKETQDNATPSGNSLAAMGLLKLARLTGRMDLEEKAVSTLETMSGQLERMPLSAGLSLMALDFLLGPTHEIVVAQGKSKISDPIQESQIRMRDDNREPDDREPIARLHRRFVPNKVIHWRTDGVSDQALPFATSSVLRGKNSMRGLTTAYVCEHGKCGLPLVGDQELMAMFERL